MAYDYDLHQKPKSSQEERDKLMKEFLEKGGKIEKCEPGYPLNVGSLDKSKKPSWTRQEIKEGKTGNEQNTLFVNGKKTCLNFHHCHYQVYILNLVK